MSRLFLFIMVSLCSITMLQAQCIKGYVFDECNTPIEYANALLLLQSDSSFVEGTITDANGHFSFDNRIDTEGYILKVSYVSYKDKYVEIHNNSKIDSIILHPDNIELNEVIVRGNKKIVSKNNYGISANIENSYLSHTGNANDVLSHLPLFVEKEDGIQILGKGKPVIYIDNRLVKDESELERLSSNSIKHIDIITKPGSEYSSSVKAVVKIYTIRTKNRGFEINMQSYVNMRERTSEYIGGELRYNYNGLNVFINGDFLDNRRDYERRTAYTTKQSETSYRGDVSSNGQNAHVSGGISYDWKQHSWGVRYEYATVPSNKEQQNLNVDDSNFFYTTKSKFQNESNSQYINAYYNGKIAAWLTEFNFDYSRGLFDKLSNINESHKTNPIVYTTKDSYNLLAAQWKFNRHFKENAINFGAEYHRTTLNSVQQMLQKNDEKELSDVDNINKQLLAAVFADYNHEWEHMSLIAGVRLEHTRFDYYEHGRKIQEQSQKYTTLLPYLTFNYDLGNIEAGLSLREYIERPSYASLGNVTTYTSSKTRWQGNPYLESTQTFDINMDLMYRELMVSLGAQFIKNGIFEVNQSSSEDESILIVKPINLPKYNCYYLDASYSFHCGIWHPILNASVQYQNLKYGINQEKYNKPLGEFFINNRFSFKRDWNIWLSFGYRTNGNYATGYTYGYKNLGLTISKSFFNKALLLKLDCRDILNTGREKIKVETNNLLMMDSSIGNTRAVKFSITYKFKRLSDKFKGRGTSQDEIARLKRVLY